MGVYIKGMEMPKEPDEMIEVAIFGDGKVVQTGESWRSPDDGKCYYTTTNPEKFFPAVSVPPNGRLIDASEEITVQMYDEQYEDFYQVKMTIDDLLSQSWIDAKAPTVIEAEEEICTKN